MRQTRNGLVAAAIVGATDGNVEPGECVVGAPGPGSVLGRSGGRGRNRRRRRERNRITALLPLWLLRTTASPAVSTRVERLHLGEQLLLRAWPARPCEGNGSRHSC